MPLLPCQGEAGRGLNRVATKINCMSNILTILMSFLLRIGIRQAADDHSLAGSVGAGKGELRQAAGYLHWV